jgi:hypothetical protein
VAAEGRYVMATKASAPGLSLKNVPTQVSMYGAAAPALTPETPSWLFVCSPGVGSAPAMGSGVSVRASLISVWTADARAVGCAPLRSFERQAGASVPGLEFSRSNFPGLP